MSINGVTTGSSFQASQRTQVQNWKMEGIVNNKHQYKVPGNNMGFMQNMAAKSNNTSNSVAAALAAMQSSTTPAATTSSSAPTIGSVNIPGLLDLSI